MAKADFEIPTLQEYPEIPAVVPGTMAHSKPFVAKPQFQEPLNYPGELPEDWHDQAISAMALDGECIAWQERVRDVLANVDAP